MKHTVKRMLRQCANKRVYADWPSVRAAMRQLRRKTKGYWREYKCEYCGGYHLTTKRDLSQESESEG